jgi:type IV secretory pathway component VirB8
MNVVAQVISRQDISGGPLWLKRVQSQAEEIKKSEEIASQDRFQKLQEIDRKREAAFAEKKARRSRDDRFFLILIGVGVLLVIIIIAILTLAFG